MNSNAAAMAFGKSYSEATRKPGTRRPRRHEDEDEGRSARMGMRTLGDQVAGEEEEESEARLAFTCPKCGETNNVKLPEGWTVAEGEDEEEAEGRGQRLQAKCAECGETYTVEPPDGSRFAKRKAGEAAAGFARAYGQVPKVREASVRHGHLAAAMRVR